MPESAAALSTLRQNYANLDAHGRELLFIHARTFNEFHDKPVTHETLHSLYELLKWGPTSANGLPARFLFIESPAEKEKLRPCLLEGNVAKTMKAPVTVAVAADLKFWTHLPRLFPPADMTGWFKDDREASKVNAVRDASLQGAYMIMAARALGLDCGPMAGFDTGQVAKTFFAEQDVIVLFLCNIGYGKTETLTPRLPRFDFDEVCRIV